MSRPPTLSGTWPKSTATLRPPCPLAAHSHSHPFSELLNMGFNTPLNYPVPTIHDGCTYSPP